MGTHGRPPTLLAACVILLAVISYTDAESCKPASCGKAAGNNIFQYAPGHTYTYHLDGQSLIDAPEQQGAGVTLQLKATAEVHFGTDCSNTIKLRDVQVTGPTAKKYGDLKDLEAHALRFSWNDGQLETDVCGEEGDSNTALNIKRAIISLLQVSTPTSSGSAQKHETDVFGLCPTDFVINRVGSETHVTKTRNLNKCAHREHLKLRVAAPHFHSPSELQTSPVLEASLNVELVVKAGVLQTAESSETYLYRPFANKDNGGRTAIKTKLTFVSESAGAEHKVSGGVSHSIVFDAPHDASTSKSSSAAVVSALQKAKAAMPDSVGSTAAAEFRHVVEVFRQTNKNDLLTVYGQVKAGAGFADKVSARKLYLHALLRAGTGESVQVAVELLKNNEISNEHEKLWHHSLAFVRHATLPALTAAGSLIQAASTKSVYLGVGSLLGKYCDEHPCAGLKEVDDILSKLSKPLAAGCKTTTHAEEDTLIGALKGLENAKTLNEKTAEILRVCAADTSAAARVRVAALDTYRTDACQPQLKKSALEILSDRSEDSEIRIKAYLAAVECPSGKIANAVKTLLDNEPVNQVGSYIVSHLRNIRASKNPNKKLQKHEFSEIRSSKRFPEDWRRFSHNQELSYFLDAVNIGASLERSVIFSQESYLPRSAEVKVTSEVFGHTFNILELESRAQNLDRIVEAYFGPRGVLRTHDFEGLLHNGTEALHNLRSKIQDRARQSLKRPKRSVPENKLEAFRQQVALDNDRRNIDLDLNVKVFDANVGFLSYHGDTKEFNADALIDKIFSRVDGCVDKLKSFNHDIKSHGQLFESELAYPTGFGFPLKLSASVTAAVHLKLDGKIDIQAIVKDPKNAHIQFEVVPSSSVEVRGLLSIDAYAVEAGLAIAATLHSSTGVNVDIKSVDGSGFDLQVGLPVKKQELLNLKSEVTTSVKEVGHSSVETAVAFNTKRKDYHGCFDQLSSLIGLTFCGDVGVPFEGVSSKAAFFPLNGPAKLLVTVESDDVTNYKFRAVANVKDPERRSLELLIDTPNSKTSRRVELLLEANQKPNRELRIKLTSPYKTALAEAVRVANDKEQSLTLRLLNDEEQYLVKLGASVSGSSESRTYTPLLQVSTPTSSYGKKGDKTLHVGGSVTVNHAADSNKVIFNHVEVTLPAGHVAVDGWVATAPHEVSSDLLITHGDSNTITLKSKLQRPGPRVFDVDVEVVSSQYPDLGVHAKWDYNRAKDQLETNLNVVHGSDLTSTESRVTAQVLAKYQWVNVHDFDLSAKGKVAYPLIGVVGHLEGAGTPKSVSYKLEGTYQQHQVRSHLSAKKGVNAPNDYDVEFEAKVLDSSVKLASKRDVVSGTESRFTNSLELTPGGRYELNSDVTCRSEPGNVLRRIQAEVKIPDAGPYKLDAGVELTAKVLEGHAKASVAAVDWVDVSVKLSKPPNPSGSFKALIKDHVDGAGTFKYTDGAGSLAVSVDLKKLGRKLKAAGDLAVTGTKHVGNLDVFFDFEKDPSRKIHIASSTDLKSGSVDSQNTLQVFEHTTVVNFKGSLEGKLTDGHMIADADVTLPNGGHFTYSVDRVLHVKPGNTDFNVKAKAAFKNKAGQQRSVEVAARGDKIDLRRRVLDTDYDFVYTNAEGNTVNYNVLVKSIPDGDHHKCEFKGLVKGTLLELRPLVHIKADIHKPAVDYYAKIDLAPDFNLELTGKVDPSVDGKPFHSSNNLELNLPTGELKNIKVDESWTFKRGQDGGPCHLEGWCSTTYNKEKTVKVTVDLTGNKQEGKGKVSLLTPNDVSPRIVEGSFKVDKTEGVKSEAAITLTHGDKNAHWDVSVTVPEARNALDITLNGKTSLEKLKTVTLVFHGTKSEKTVDSELTLTVNDKKTHVVTKHGTDPRNPLVELTIDHPGGRSLFKYHLTRKDTGTGEFESNFISEHKGETFSSKVAGRAPSVHDFDITIDLDSKTKVLTLNNIHVRLSHDQSTSGKTIKVEATEAGQNIIDGSLDYRYEDGSNAVLYEATGKLKVKNEEKAAKILVKRDNINIDGEKGQVFEIHASLGDALYELSFKKSNKEFHSKTNLCKKKDECGHSDVSFNHRISVDEVWSEFKLDYDWTGLGREQKLSLHGVAERNANHVQHLIEVVDRLGAAYKYNLLITDKDATVSVTTPNRVVEADAKYVFLVDKVKHHVNHKFEVSGWLDKIKEPTLKSTLLLEVDVVRADDSLTIVNEARFQHPSISKDLVVKGKTLIGGRSILDSFVELDVFAKRGQKITIDAKIVKNTIDSGFNYTASWDIKSKGQSLEVSSESHVAISTSVVGIGSTLTYKDDKQGKKDLGFGYQATPQRIAFFVKSPKDLLIGFECNHQLVDGRPKVDASIEIVGLKAVALEAHVEAPNKLVYVVYKKATPERKVTGLLQLELASKLLAHSEWHQAAEKKELFNVALSWNTDNKPVVSYNLENAKELLTQTQNDVALGVEKLKSASQSVADGATVEVNDVIEGLKKAKPNLLPLIAAYEAQIKQIRDEIEKDQLIQGATDGIKKLVGSASESLSHVGELLVKIADKALDLFEQFSTALLNSLKRLIPSVTQSVNKLFQVSIDISNALVNSLLIALQNLVELIKKHEAEFQQVVTVVAEIGRDVARVVGKGLDQTWRELRDFCAVLTEQLKALPVYGMIQERIQELKQQLKEYSPPEQVFETLHEVTNALQDTLPTEELKEFVKAVSEYIEKVLKKQDVDDIPALRAIYTKLVAAIRSIFTLVRSEVATKDAPNVIGAAWPLSLKNLFRVPLLAAVRLSPLDFLRSDDLPTLRELWFTYRPTLNPLDWIPPFNSYGILIDQSHFFTLDGRHFTFLGTCSYVLAQDIVNGNFTLVLNLEGGKFKSLQLSDDQDTVEVIKGGSILLNGAPSELPLSTHNINGWARHHSINLKTNAGVHVKVDVDHHFAVFHVSGFYHGQVRGLLGDLNNEQYDDFRLPSGKVSEDVTEFGNAYHVGGACPPGAASPHHGHHGHHEAECSNLFAANSPLRAAFPVVDPTAFREACDHYLSETADKKTEYACRVAAAYVDLARKHNSYVDVPAKCAVCHAGKVSWQSGDTLAVASSNSADVVIVVEQVTANAEIYKELVTPLVTSLTNDLKAKGINDVEFSLIGYGHPHKCWPQHFTSGGKISFNGNANIEFGDPEKPAEHVSERREKWNKLKHNIAVEIGRTKTRDAIKEVLTFPFRAGASKTVIIVTASGCEYSVVPFGLQKIRLLLAQKESRDRGIPVHVITNLDEFNVAGSSDAKLQKSVVGFDSQAVYSLSDAKKKSLEGNEDLRKDIEFQRDICSDFSQHTDGATFHAGNFLEGKTVPRKNFLTVVSHRVVDSLVGDFSEDCTCKLYHGKHAETRCKITARKEAKKGKGKN